MSLPSMQGSTPLDALLFLIGAGCSLACVRAAHAGERRGPAPSRPTGFLHVWLSGAGGGLFVLSYVFESSWWARIVWFAFWLTLITVVATDIESMRVPNRISLSAAVLFTAFGFLNIPHPLISNLLGALVCSGLLLAIHLLTRGRGMGMGDVKLYLSVGAMLGPLQGIESLICASAVASLVGGVLLAAGRLDRRQPFAFVPYIFVGVVFAVFIGPTMNAWYASTLLHGT